MWHQVLNTIEHSLGAVKQTLTKTRVWWPSSLPLSLPPSQLLVHFHSQSQLNISNEYFHSVLCWIRNTLSFTGSSLSFGQLYSLKIAHFLAKKPFFPLLSSQHFQQYSCLFLYVLYFSWLIDIIHDRGTLYLKHVYMKRKNWTQQNKNFQSLKRQFLLYLKSMNLFSTVLQTIYHICERNISWCLHALVAYVKNFRCSKNRVLQRLSGRKVSVRWF